MIVNILFLTAIIVFGFALLSKKIAHSVLSLPIIFTALGYSISLLMPELRWGHEKNEMILIIAEVTLVLVLFSDAARVNFKGLRSYLGIPLRMLFIGMPLTLIFGTLLTHWVSPQAPLAFAVLVAAVLTPTDAALGQAVVTSETLPLRMRQSISIESGLNDGLIVPFVTIAAIMSAQAFGVHSVEHGSLTIFTLKQILLGPLAGVMIGCGGAYLLNLSVKRKLIEEPLMGLVYLSVAFGSYLFANLIGGNGFIAAFIGGLAFGFTLKDKAEAPFSFMESEGQLLTMIAFIAFGALLLPLAIAHLSVKTLVLALGFLTVVRIVPIWLSLLGTGLNNREKLFLGWFGPRGLASILFSIIVIEEYGFPDIGEFLACVVLTVALSIVLHGVTARPLSDRMGTK